MPPKIKDKTNKSTTKKAGEMRRSQSVGTFGSGAIVDFPRLSGIMAGIDYWNINRIPEAKIHEHNLETMLGKEFFIQVSSPDNFDYPFGMPVYRFPRMYYCPECHMLDTYTKIRKPINNNSEYNSNLYCNYCNSNGLKIKLIPSRFVVSCLNGHIDDFPYAWWVHKNKGFCENPQLFLEYKGTTGGLDSIHVSCKCGAHTTMEGCMNKETFKAHKCQGTMPWLGFAEGGRGQWYTDTEDCNATLRTMQRSANNVYYAVNQSALTIPPWSAKIQRIMNHHIGTLEFIFDQEDDNMLINQLKHHYKQKAHEYKCPEDVFIKEAFRTYRGSDEDAEIDEESLRINEYKAFCLSDTDHDYFKVESSPVPCEFSHLITQIKIAKRLREVLVLRGFRRILPAYEPDEEKRKELGLFEREFSPISRQPMPWLPAVELFGEGIFIQFNNEAVQVWEKENSKRYEDMSSRLDQPWIGKNMFSKDNTRYVLLHTFAHLLIRQLTSQCGYATASLKEKVYSTFNDSKEESMCGVLIYTASTDSDGSLGGLAREGDGERLCNTILALLQEASWCSNDPICIDSKSQGFKSLNYAACHACALLPETSCEASNCLLDRAAVTGTPDNKEIAFFKDFL